MPFACPSSNRLNSLRVLLALELPPDSRSDEITLQVVECEACGFAAPAVYEESRRGAIDREQVHHNGYWVERALVDALAAALRACPQPWHSNCLCATHQALGRRDRNDRWIGIPEMVHSEAFEMVYTADSP